MAAWSVRLSAATKVLPLRLGRGPFLRARTGPLALGGVVSGLALPQAAGPDERDAVVVAGVGPAVKPERGAGGDPGTGGGLPAATVDIERVEVAAAEANRVAAGARRAHTGSV